MMQNLPPDPWMKRALELAQQALYLTSPNPRVGCVLVNTSGERIGEGHTQAVGGPHAEIMALRDAAARGSDTTGSTAYVTLEPCNHHGRTGPCTQALIQAGIRKVVASAQDPNPLVAGSGFAALRGAGIEVVVGEGQTEAVELNIGFFKRISSPKDQAMPWVRMKAAASLDGITALSNGVSQWITDEPARQDGHAWRARACSVLTGIGTVLADDPLLDVRHVATPRQPTLVLVDSALQTPLTARLLAVKRPLWIYCAVQDFQKQAALQALGAQVICLPNTSGKVDLPAMMRDLASRQINELHIEAGFKLNGSLWREGLVDELLLYQSAKLLGQGQGIAQLGILNQLSQAPALRWHSIERIGEDLRILARKH